MARKQVNMARTSGNQRFLVRDFGTCLQFDGSGDYVTLAQTSGLPLYTNTDFSVSMWFKTGDIAQADKRLYSEGSSSTDNPLYTFGVNVTGFRFLVRDSNGTPIFSQFGSAAFTREKWYHVVFSDSNGTVKLYLNGVDITSTLPSSTYTRPALTFDRITIGALLRAGLSSEYTGKIDQVRLYKSTLTLAMVRDLYYRGVEVDSDNLVGYYKFDEGSGTTATDSSGLGNTGTIVNATYSTDVFMKNRSTSGTRMVPIKNYLPTPNMDVDGGSGIPSGWSTYNDSAGQTIVNSIDPTVFSSGSASLKMTEYHVSSTFTNNWVKIDSLTVPAQFLLSGASFEVFVRYKQLANTYSAVTLSASGISDVTVYSRNGVQDNWVEVTKKVTIPKKISSLNIRLECKNPTAGQTATVWFDEVRLRKSGRTVA